jgi:hypothetical protein
MATARTFDHIRSDETRPAPLESNQRPLRSTSAPSSLQISLTNTDVDKAMAEDNQGDQILRPGFHDGPPAVALCLFNAEVVCADRNGEVNVPRAPTSNNVAASKT